MSRIATRFQQRQQQQRKLLIPFITAGDPQPELCVPLMHALVEAGADILELGVPFSDPMADGPVIQRASERALAHRVTLRQVLEMVRNFRQQDSDTPVILMGYLNPIEIMGYSHFAEEAAAAGVDGVLTVDLPPEEAAPLLERLRKHQIDPIFLLAPTSSEQRIQQICDAASGFVYYVSVKGITGSGSLDIDAVTTKLEQIRSHTTLPLGVGFGIHDAASARAVAAVADAVIVGSALVRQIEAHTHEPHQIIPAVTALLGTMRQAMDGN